MALWWIIFSENLMTNRTDEPNLPIQTILKEIQTEWDGMKEIDKQITPQEWFDTHYEMMLQWQDDFRNK